MKIFINKEYKIKDIDFTEDLSLTEIEIDRDQVFGAYSDFVILNYCYEPVGENGYMTYPVRNLSDILEEEKNYLRIENRQLKQELFTLRNINILEEK